ncbi:MAG: ribonuclease P component 1 family protein [Candidatus Helarchaeales archaeon]
MKTSLKEKKILSQELIGARIQIEHATDPTLIDVSGTIVNETKNMFMIMDEKTEKIKKVAKNIGIFKITLPDGLKFRIKGTLLMSRPEDRLKKMKKMR